MFALLRSLISYRGFVFSSIRNEFVARFARSRLGGLWMVIHPLAQVAIFALVLSSVLSARLPGVDNKFVYALYLMSGILAWSLFAEVITRCLTLFIDKGNLMKKISFPRITLPAIVVGSSLLNYTLLFVALLLVFALLGHSASVAVAWLLPLTLALVALSLGIGLIFGVLNVFVRDVGQVVPIILQAWFWLTPITYPVGIIPDQLKSLVVFNPMFAIVTAYHDVLVYGRTPDLQAVAIIAMVSVGLLLLGLFLFRRASAEMVDAL